MNSADVVIIDYGIGNMLSVKRGLEYCGVKVTISAEQEEILSASRVVLPGVGAFGNAMEALHNLDLVDVIHKVVEKKTPLLGICLGMQLLMDESNEFGLTKGLGLISGKVVSLPVSTVFGEANKIPHIGWNDLVPVGSPQGLGKKIMQNIALGESTYFVHSFMAEPADPINRIANCIYGGNEIAAIIARDNIVGCQFHPEKSGKVGLNILKSFVSS